MTTTPLLSTFVQDQIERRDLQTQTALPAKVIAWDSDTNTVTLEPQFIETRQHKDGTRIQETISNEGRYITNVPVCFPRYISWDITPGNFGLVICTKYSLNAWRTNRKATDPGDLRRFTMSGATFHPVLMDEVPSASQDFVALKADVEDIKTYLDQIKASFNVHYHSALGGAPVAQNPPYEIPITTTYTVQASTWVKVL